MITLPDSRIWKDIQIEIVEATTIAAAVTIPGIVATVVVVALVVVKRTGTVTVVACCCFCLSFNALTHLQYA